MSRGKSKARFLAAVIAPWLISPGGCDRSTTKVELQKQVDQLRVENDRLKRESEVHKADIQRLQSQVANLQSFKDPRGATLFAPTRLEILSLSRGANYDDAPGDDGVTVHFRPLDDEGNVITVAGAITVQLVDNSILGQPKVVGLLGLSEPEEVRAAWHSKFLTNQYTIKCPFNSTEPIAFRQLDVRVEFTDYLTGTPLRAERVVEVTPPDSPSAPPKPQPSSPSGG